MGQKLGREKHILIFERVQQVNEHKSWVRDERKSNCLLLYHNKLALKEIKLSPVNWHRRRKNSIIGSNSHFPNPK